ncbi:MAG: hypothetical protein U1E29_04965 [Coriobacteriia bacterium]|nr:hypothetical protein [Coriobacteriia bacterium]
MTESRASKAARAIVEHRVRVLSADVRSIALHIRSEHQDPDTLRDREYDTSIGVDSNGVLVRECTCANALAHPIQPRCWHVFLAEKLWMPRSAAYFDEQQRTA